MCRYVRVLLCSWIAVRRRSIAFSIFSKGLQSEKSMNLKTCSKRLFPTLAHIFISHFVFDELYLVARLECEHAWRYCPGGFSLPAVWWEVTLQILLHCSFLDLLRGCLQSAVFLHFFPGCLLCSEASELFLEAETPPTGTRDQKALDLDLDWGWILGPVLVTPEGVPQRGWRKGRGPGLFWRGGTLGYLKHSWSPVCSGVQGLWWVVLLNLFISALPS